MADLQFGINMEGEKPAPSVEAPKEVQENVISGYLKRSSHPIALIFHFAFKIISVLAYFILGFLISDDTFCFIIIVLLSAFDFWTVQNITGRLLVGLRWRNVIREDGSEEWVYESLDQDAQSNKVDLYGFWIGLIGMPLVWGLLLVANVLTFDLMWVSFIQSMMMSVCLAMSGINLYGYYKCRSDHKQKLKGILKQGAIKAAVQGI